MGLCEALPECGGYKVHKDKLVRMGVPIYTSHTVLSANGDEEVRSVTIAKIDKRWKPHAGTEQTFACDTVLVAVGLEPVDEFVAKAQEFGLPVFAAGDSEEIAEASAAMFTGRIRGLEIARALGRDVGEVPPEWHRTAEVLKSRPGATVTEDLPGRPGGVYPGVPLRPGNPLQPVHVDLPAARHPHRGRRPHGPARSSSGTSATPARSAWPSAPAWPSRWSTSARTRSMPSVTVPYEFTAKSIAKGDTVTVLDTEGAMLGNVEVTRVREAKSADRCLLVRVKAPARDRAADCRHPRAGAVGHRSRRALGAAPRRRR